jgi:hypothetical protein
MKIMWKLGCSSRSNRYKATVTDKDTGGGINRGRSSGGENTGIRGDMIGGASVEVPFMLGGLL